MRTFFVGQMIERIVKLAFKHHIEDLGSIEPLYVGVMVVSSRNGIAKHWDPSYGAFKMYVFSALRKGKSVVRRGSKVYEPLRCVGASRVAE